MDIIEVELYNEIMFFLNSFTLETCSLKPN